MRNENSVKFTDMHYERPDKDAAILAIRDLTMQLESAQTYEEARAVFLEQEALSDHIATAHALAMIRHSIDTRDPFYDAEEKFFNAFMPELAEYEQQWTLAMLKSPFRQQFEEEFGSLLFLNAEIELKSFRPEIIPEMQAENDLVQEYEKLLASAQILLKNAVYTLPQMQPFKNDPNHARRLAA